MRKAKLSTKNILRPSRCETILWLLSLLVLLLAETAFSLELNYGVIQDEDGYVNVRKGPGTEYEIVENLRRYEEILFRQGENNWCKVYSKADTAYLGYVHESRIEIIDEHSSPGAWSYYLTFSKDGETGFVGRIKPNWGEWFYVPDSSNRRWFTAHKRISMRRSVSPGVISPPDRFETMRMSFIPFDSVEIGRCNFGLLKRMKDFDGGEFQLLTCAMSYLPVYTDSSSIECEQITKCLPLYYKPVPHKPFYNNFFDENYHKFLRKEYGEYGCLAKKIDFFFELRFCYSVTVDKKIGYIIIAPQSSRNSAAYYFSRKKFANLDAKPLNPNPEIEDCIRKLLDLNVSSILSEYGKPLYMTDDIIIYITGPHRRYCERVFHPESFISEGEMKEVRNGLMFFEVENDRVIVAGHQPLF